MLNFSLTIWIFLKGYNELFTYLFHGLYNRVVDYVCVVDIQMKSDIMDRVLHSSQQDG